MFQSREGTVRKIMKGMQTPPFGIISERRKKQSMQEQDMLRLAMDLCAEAERGTINMAGTGSAPEKTAVCALLCETMARMGRRVLFLCLKQQMTETVFDNSGQKRPMQDFLDGLCGVRDILSYDREKKVYQIVGGMECALGNDGQYARLHDLLRSCGSLMDYVIVDGPDLEEGGLAVWLAGVCDASVFMMTAQQNHKAQFARAKSCMEEIKALSAHFIGYIVCQTKDAWSLPAIWQEMPGVTKRCRRQMMRAACRKGMRHLGWAAPFLVFAFVAAVFSANNMALSVFRLWAWPVRYSPWRGTMIAAGVALGTWFWMVKRYASENRTIKREEQAEECLGERLLESLPGGNLKRKKHRERYERALSALCVKVKFWEQQNEVVKDKNVQENERQAGSIFMVTSTLEGEGKTTLAWNLAEMLSKNGASVMLIDADVNSRLMTSWLQSKKHVSIPWDLQDLMEARASAEQAILQITESQVYFLGLNREVFDPLQFFLSDELAETLAAVKKSMDYVIVDAPPAFFACTELLAKQSDGILYAIGYDEADVDQIRSGLQRMNKTKVPVIGTVLCRQQR